MADELKLTPGYWWIKDEGGLTIGRVDRVEGDLLIMLIGDDRWMNLEAVEFIEPVKPCNS